SAPAIFKSQIVISSFPLSSGTDRARAINPSAVPALKYSRTRREDTHASSACPPVSRILPRRIFICHSAYFLLFRLSSHRVDIHVSYVLICMRILRILQSLHAQRNLLL